jgi:hypothetical protein
MKCQKFFTNTCAYFWKFHVQNGFFSVSSHVFPISSGFQLTLFPRARWAWPRIPTFLRTGSRKLWIQATARFSIGHTYPELSNHHLKTQKQFMRSFSAAATDRIFVALKVVYSEN